MRCHPTNESLLCAPAALSAAQASLDALAAAQASLDEQRRVEASEQTYLRNVLLKYMESEDHHTMFPVVATVLRFTHEEVMRIKERRERRESGRGGEVMRRLSGAFFG